MTARAFDTPIADDDQSLVGQWRSPQQMLATQVYDGHVSIHDDAMAKKMGFKAATIEGPTHFSQFAPLCAHLWGEAWFETGCISAHYRNAVFYVFGFLQRPVGGFEWLGNLASARLSVGQSLPRLGVKR